jgi:hypothetical protein
MACEHQFVPITTARTVTVPGIIGAIAGAAGLLLLIFNVFAGLVLIALGVITGLIGRNKTVVRCAKCGEPAPFG